MPRPTDDAIAQLVDRHEIHEALMRYCRGVDRCDEELMRSVYHEDATDHHGAYSGPAWDFVAMFVPSSREESTFTQHAIANLSIDLDGDRAASEAYFVAYVGRMEDGAEVIDVFGGRYVDQWERRENGWGVTDRKVVHEWSRANAFGTQPFPLPTELFVQPVRGREDVSFAGAA
jgi:hypothetical protein